MLTPTLASAQEILHLHKAQFTPSAAAVSENLKVAQTPGGHRAVYNGRLAGPSPGIYHPVFQ